MRAIILVFTFVFGLCVGSFLNVVIYRVPKKMSVAFPPSFFPNCKTKIKPYDNIPLFSYLFRKGKYRFCRRKTSFRNTIIELLNAVLWFLYVLNIKEVSEKSVFTAVLSFAVMSILLVISAIDIDKKLIYDRFIVVLLFIAVIRTAFMPYGAWYDHLIGGVSAFFVFYAVGVISDRILRKECLGGGDIKLVTVTALFLSWQNFVLSMLIASVIGSIVILILSKIQNAEKGREYPFAPFISLGTVTAVIYGEKIIDWYVNLF